MQEIRGTILLAERTYQTNANLWIIAGILNQMWISTTGGGGCPVQIHLYIRLQVEKVGDLKIVVKLIDRGQPPTHASLMELELTAHVTNPGDPVEMGFAIPPFVVGCPEQVVVGAPQGRTLTAWLRVNEIDVASANLALIFRHPYDNIGPQQYPSMPPTSDGSDRQQP